jgi:hypothetical protein
MELKKSTSNNARAHAHARSTDLVGVQKVFEKYLRFQKTVKLECLPP